MKSNNASYDLLNTVTWKEKVEARISKLLRISLPRPPMTIREKLFVVVASLISFPTSGFLLYQAYLIIRSM